MAMTDSPHSDLVPVRRALLSVSDKSGLVDLARALAARGADILSTGGSARALKDAGLLVTEVSDFTGFPEILDGRVKTLHPRIHGGLLGRRDDPAHRAAMSKHDLHAIDLVAVNLYPFEATIAAGAHRATAIENIDIGGPALIRSAAKNHAHVAVLTDPAQYPELIQALEAEGGTRLPLRRRLAAAAYARTASYDAAIAAWAAREEGELFPERLTLAGQLAQQLRYGENPHQRAAFYTTGERRTGLAAARQLQGKELSYNNLNDTDAALELVAEFEEPAVVIVKHANPCGVAVGEDLAEAWNRALACDPVSAYGGIVALNRPLDALTAMALSELFLEVVIAPGIDEAARVALAAKKNLRLTACRTRRRPGW
jgi:phosphoribosylaminoimidazolecarboxamide formyltransferase/IMP cyclohydrolase